jgi:hypothetical protein
MAVKLEKNYRPVVPVNSNLTVYFLTTRNTNIKSLYTSLCVLCEMLGALRG